MKKTFAILLVAILLLSFAGCGDKSAPANEGGSSDSAAKIINLWSFTDEIPGMMDRFKAFYKEKNGKDFPYEIKTNVVATDNGGYQTALDQALAGGGADAPDIYAAEAAFVLKYTQGEASQYASTYSDLGIDVDNAIKDAQIAQYTVDVGSRDGKVVGLGFQATGSAVFYRRSIAKAVWGTDDPAEIGKKIGPGWDQFFKGAADLKAKGYKAVSGQGDIWKVITNDPSAPHGWLVDGVLDPPAQYLDYYKYAKELYDNEYSNRTGQWTDAWQADMEPDSKVFAFFGPAWLLNYVIAANHPDTSGDFAVCESPVPFFWGGTWVLANKDTKVKEGVADIINWITLDTSDDGLQYHWANGTMALDGSKSTGDTVASGVVMAKSDGSMDYVGGQNVFDIFVPANANASGKNMGPYDETLNSLFDAEVTAYVEGNKSMEDGIKAFKENAKSQLDLDSN